MFTLPSELESKQTLLTEKLKQMRQHSVFSSLQRMENLQKFMEWHVFAVWDFMSLAKRLQQDLTCVTLPWMPNQNSQAAQLINEIILGEETDTLPNKQPCSHFEMYLMAMKEIGASTAQIDTFIQAVQQGTADAQNAVRDALVQVNAAPAIQDFVNFTIDIALKGKTSQVLASFFYGREDSIPEMFSHLLETWSINKEEAPTFVYYLDRHIELDGDKHGPAVQKIINDQFNQDLDAWHELFDCAIKSAEMRIALWDALEESINADNAVALKSA